MRLLIKAISPEWVVGAVLLVMLAPSTAYSQLPDSVWQVQQAVGEVTWRQLSPASNEAPWLPLNVGEMINPPAEIETAAGARVVLLRAGDSIQAGPESRLMLEDPPHSLLTRIRQAAGAIWYKVQSIAGRQFEVEGTYLVATVKGTEFKVTVGKVGDLLMVTEGLVRASPRVGGEAMDVKRGQSVLATSAGLLLLTPQPDGERSPAAPGTPATPGQPDPAPNNDNPPNEDGHTGKTGDVHGVNGSGKHNHGGTGGANVRDMHGDSVSGNGGGAKAAGPK